MILDIIIYLELCLTCQAAGVVGLGGGSVQLFAVLVAARLRLTRAHF